MESRLHQKCGRANGNEIHFLTVDPVTPTTLYAFIGDDVLKSMDGGENWSTAVNTGLSNSWLIDLAIVPATPTTLYVATGSGAFKSTDGGKNWHALTGLTNSAGVTLDVYTLVVDPATPTTLYAGTFYNGVYKSTDGGENWSASNTGLPVANVHP